MRRLPVFFVLDCSESMIGENLKKMTDGLQMIIGDLRKDPHALETATGFGNRICRCSPYDCTSSRNCLVLPSPPSRWRRYEPWGRIA